MSDYEVGYGKPPKQHRFKKGQASANPRGRPKGRKSKGVLEKLDEKVVVETKNGRRVKKSLLEVFSHGLVKDALAGDKQSRMFVYRAVENAEKEEATRKHAEARRPPGHRADMTPDEARSRLKELVAAHGVNKPPHIDEAIRLGIFEMYDGKLRVAAWARQAAQDRHVATDVPKLEP